MNEEHEPEMLWLCKLPTPVYGTQCVGIKSFIDTLKTRLRHAKDNNKHFGWKLDRYEIAIDEDGVLWMVGFTK